jgi:DNA gyrase subunit A
MEIKKILDELKEKKAEAARIEAILQSKRKLWGVVKQELNELGEKYADRRCTRLSSEEDTPDFDPEAYIVRENTNVVLTRDGWIKRVGRLASVESTRVREGDEVIAVIPGSTLDHVVFLADDGIAYTMRINEVPVSSGYGEPVAKFFRLGDSARMVNAITSDERFTPGQPKRSNGDVPGPYLLVVTAQGQALRTPLLPFRTESTKVGRRYVRLNEGDRVVLAIVPNEEESIFLASTAGHVIHFPIEQINILAGSGKGVMGIKLADDDSCLGGALISGRFDTMRVETTGGNILEFRRGKYEVTSRGGKGFQAVKRTRFVRVVPAPIQLVDWDAMEGKDKDTNANGKQKNLFD